MIFYAHNPNAIVDVHKNNRSQGELMRAYEEVYKELTTEGYISKLGNLDKKPSKDIKSCGVRPQRKHPMTP